VRRAEYANERSAELRTWVESIPMSQSVSGNKYGTTEQELCSRLGEVFTDRGRGSMAATSRICDPDVGTRVTQTLIRREQPACFRCSEGCEGHSSLRTLTFIRYPPRLMRRAKTYYEFRQAQVFTPPDVVKLFWRIVLERRPRLNSVLDLGAGDGRFARGGHFKRYLGIEIDPATPRAALPKKAKLRYGCAFRLAGGNWDAVIGNPPYVRHHYIELPWTERVAKRFKKRLDIRLNGQANLFVYFLLLGVELSADNGLVAMVTPYEWVSRPSAKPLRDLIERNGWSVDVYRFRERIFDEVMTTASISVIDKADKSGKWRFFEIDGAGAIRAKRQRAGSKFVVLPYARRGKWWALRGLSPGTQRVFTLTEGERIHQGLSLEDVWPCVTSLMPLPTGCSVLDEAAFRKHYRDAGERCWLIRSSEKTISVRLRRYLESIQPETRATSTCMDRETWYAYKAFPVSRLLVASGFVSHGPKVVKNSIKAHHVGSVYGVFGPRVGGDQVAAALREYNFEGRVVQHSGRLRKIEVRQLNAALTNVCETE
jgi:hypothetical protein